MKFAKPTHFPCVGFPLRFFIIDLQLQTSYDSNNRSCAECWGYRGSFILFQWFLCLCHPSPAFMNISNFIFHPQDSKKMTIHPLLWFAEGSLSNSSRFLVLKIWLPSLKFSNQWHLCQVEIAIIDATLC